MPRRFEFVASNSAKFWEVSVSSADVTVRYGRLGAEGQTQTKTFADAGQAQKHADSLVAQKIGKGYQETSAA